MDIEASSYGNQSISEYCSSTKRTLREVGIAFQDLSLVKSKK